MLGFVEGATRKELLCNKLLDIGPPQLDGVEVRGVNWKNQQGHVVLESTLLDGVVAPQAVQPVLGVADVVAPQLGNWNIPGLTCTHKQLRTSEPEISLHRNEAPTSRCFEAVPT